MEQVCQPEIFSNIGRRYKLGPIPLNLHHCRLFSFYFESLWHRAARRRSQIEADDASLKTPTNLDRRENQDSPYEEMAINAYETIRSTALNRDNGNRGSTYNYIGDETYDRYLDPAHTPDYSEITDGNAESMNDDGYVRVSAAVTTQEGDGYLVTVAAQTASGEENSSLTVSNARMADEGDDGYLRTADAETTSAGGNGRLTVSAEGAENEDGYLRAVATELSTQVIEEGETGYPPVSTVRPVNDTDGYLRAVDTEATKPEGDGYLTATDRETNAQNDD